ncbi:CPBP family intramembrane glutamic endopeptidase [Microlunatus speluncae]|uniref:CPBP family intramembrane glutamic endopeptidase n=1 Tax=Microlunatus speluncae TaxID=2594267 RepID=UPI0012664FE2|nr:CPBP family intramembrane glutamic endopeptidase [Microlunatus speluncae]
MITGSTVRGATGSALERRPTLARLLVLIVLGAGIALLQLSFASPPGSPRFYLLSLALAAVWLAGGLLLGPISWLPDRPRPFGRTIIAPIMVGLGLAAIFLLGAVIVHRVPVLDRVLAGVFDYADRGLPALVLGITVINAAGEELFFRGALWRLVREPYRLLATTLLYALATIATGNPLLVFAAVLLALVVGRLRQVTGAVIAPILAHAAWSVTMLLAVPPLTSPGG